MRDLARRLLAASTTVSDPHEHVVARVCETLRVPLTRFAGADGFTALLRRALALASAEVPSLRGIKIAADCRLEGLEQLAAVVDTGPGEAGEASVAITAHLLGLLVIFIGEPFTLRLVREAWPKASPGHGEGTIEADC